MPDARPLPELTRGLRHLADVDDVLHSDHAVVFGPLLEARRAAERVVDETARVRALDAGALRRALTRAAETLAERRAGTPADRRALLAELLELGAPVWSALDRVDLAARELDATVGADARDAAWARWVTALADTFAAVDAWWERMLAPLAEPRGQAGRWWRRLLRPPAVCVIGALLPVAAAGQHVTLRIPGVEAESLQRRHFDVVARERDAVLVVAGPDDRLRLESLGWRGTPVLAPGADPRQALGLQLASTPRVFRPFDDPRRGVRAYLDSLSRATGRLRIDSIGASTQGRPILVVKVGPPDESSQRPNVLFMATYHAREWAATEVALRLVRWLAVSDDPRVDQLRRTRDIWVLPVANPDGYEYTFSTDRLWRKTRSPQAAGAVGVDLNRNHRTNWGLDDVGSSASPRSEVFRGPAPASEPETRAIEQFHDRFPPVMSVSYHTFAGQLLFPPGVRWGDLPGDLGIYRALAGTNSNPAVRDRLPGSPRSGYSAMVGWMLYPTNGEYTDWASRAHGAVAFTPEMSSGYEDGRYYGFEFPDDEAKVERLFQDNLPFALDVIDGAADPLGYLSPTTGLRSPRVALESVSPELRLRVPSTAASQLSARADGRGVPLRVDTAGGGRWTRRLQGPAGRPLRVEAGIGAEVVGWRVLLRSGAEASERSGWEPVGFEAIGTGPVLLGEAVWEAARGGELRSPPLTVPSDADTVSVLFWTRYIGDAFGEVPNTKVRYSLDGGPWVEAARLVGVAAAWYPEDVVIGGVRGRTLRLSIQSNGMPIRLDELHVVAHLPLGDLPEGGGGLLRPSENPLRSAVLHLTWPWPSEAGELFAYDWGGRLVWRSVVDGASATVPWSVADSALPNGAYLLLARSKGRTQRLKVLVARGAP